MSTPTTANLFTIYFILKGDDISEVSFTTIPGYHRICQLQQLIKDKEPELASVNPKHLALFTAPFPEKNRDAFTVCRSTETSVRS